MEGEEDTEDQEVKTQGEAILKETTEENQEMDITVDIMIEDTMDTMTAQDMTMVQDIPETVDTLMSITMMMLIITDHYPMTDQGVPDHYTEQEVCPTESFLPMNQTIIL